MSKKKSTTKKTRTPASAESHPDVPETADVPVPVEVAPTLIDANLPTEPAMTPAEHREQNFDEPAPGPAPIPEAVAAVGEQFYTTEIPPGARHPSSVPELPPTPMSKHIEDTIEPLATVEIELGDHDVHPEIKLPMCLIRDKKRMVRYAGAFGRNPMEAQSRREKLKLTPEVMYLYRHYKKYCERSGKRYWTERGFAATLVCFYRGVPLEEQEQEPEQDILNRISEGVTREQARK